MRGQVTTNNPIECPLTEPPTLAVARRDVFRPEYYWPFHFFAPKMGSIPYSVQSFAQEVKFKIKDQPDIIVTSKYKNALMNTTVAHRPPFEEKGDSITDSTILGGIYNILGAPYRWSHKVHVLPNDSVVYLAGSIYKNKEGGYELTPPPTINFPKLMQHTPLIVSLDPEKDAKPYLFGPALCGGISAILAGVGGAVLFLKLNQ